MARDCLVGERFVLTTFFWLLVGHAVADYPLQGDFLAKAKNHRAPLPGIPWQQALFWHALMHGGAVALVTHSVALGLAETAIHCAIDYAKCEGWTGFNTDQGLHVVCMAIWACIV